MNTTTRPPVARHSTDGPETSQSDAPKVTRHGGALPPLVTESTRSSPTLHSSTMDDATTRSKHAPDRAPTSHISYPHPSLTTQPITADKSACHRPPSTASRRPVWGARQRLAALGCGSPGSRAPAHRARSCEHGVWAESGFIQGATPWRSVVRCPAAWPAAARRPAASRGSVCRCARARSAR